ncbi:MAG: MOP flippase family protein [Deltaproteobacteria bacterium]|nr:MOP flippase family protein [Deltaproteobacteria bacterium]
MTDNLKQTTIHGLFWSFFERIGQQGVQFVISVVLARLLMPEQFGLIVMLVIFMAVAQSFIDSGFGLALIQKQDANHLDECSIFYFNIVLGFVAAGLLCLAAPWIASFYNTPILVPLARVLSLNLIINAFGIVQTSLLTKHIEFKLQMKINLSSLVMSGSIGVTMAYAGYGVWSLVAQSISSTLVRTVLLWFFLRWRPSLLFSFDSLRTMFAFGSKLLFSGLLDRIYNNLLTVVIGKVYSATDLGFYARAYSLQQVPANTISESIARVIYPAFSTIQEDKPRLKRGVRKALTTLAMVNFPLMLGLAIVAKPLVLLLLTEKWLPCVPYLQLLCGLGLLYPLHVINLNVLVAQGRSDLFFRLEVLKKVLGVTLIALTYRWGISIMIVGQIVSSIICYFVNSYYTKQFLDYSLMKQLHDLIHSLILSLLMVGGVYLVNSVFISHQLLLLILQIVCGIVLYVTLCWLTRLPSFIESVEMIKPRFKQFCSTH